MRTKLIAANWKMYKTPEEGRAFMHAFLPLVSDHTRDEIVVCPPFVDLPALVEAAKGSRVAIGAQNMSWEKEGAFTGEISPAMLLARGLSPTSLSVTPSVASISARPTTRSIARPKLPWKPG